MQLNAYAFDHQFRV